MTAGEVEDLKDRIAISLIAIPRICSLRRCRRLKRCLGADMICLRHHRGLIRERLIRRKREQPDC